MLTKKDIEIGVWRFNEGFWPNPISIEDTAVYKADRLLINLYAIDNQRLSQTKRKELIKAWQTTLIGLENLRYLYVSHQIDQDFFEAICNIPNLEGLYIKWSKVRDISGFEKLKKLKHLHFGSTPGLTDLNGIEKLSSVVSMELENFKGVINYDALKNLTTLESLIITGSINSARVKIANLDFLKHLSHLKVLVLDVSLSDGRFESILHLKNLTKLFLPDYLYKGYEKQSLLRHFPNLRYGDIQHWK